MKLSERVLNRIKKAAGFLGLKSRGRVSHPMKNEPSLMVVADDKSGALILITAQVLYFKEEIVVPEMETLHWRNLN